MATILDFEHHRRLRCGEALPVRRERERDGVSPLALWFDLPLSSLRLSLAWWTGFWLAPFGLEVRPRSEPQTIERRRLRG